MSTPQFNLKAVFSLIDKITGPLKNILGVANATSKGFGGVGASAAAASEKLDGVSRAAKNTRFSFQSVEESANRVTPAVTTMTQRIQAATAALEKYGLTANRMRKSGGHGGMLGLFGAGLAGFGAFELGKDFIHINSTLDSIHSSLITTTGSVGGADKAMAWIRNFEKKSPYDYEQVADTYKGLQAYGLNPEGGSLKAVADASGAMGKQLWQGNLAIIDAVNGMYRELKLFGIHSKDDKDKVMFSWVDPKTGKTHAQVADKGNQAAVAAVIVGGFEQRFAGGMDLMAKTWPGLISNLTSAWWRFIQAVGDSGAFTTIKDDLTKLSAWLTDNGNQELIKTWAEKIGRALTDVYFAIRDLVTKVDWVKLLADFASLVSGVTSLVDKVGGLTPLIEGFVAGWIAFKTIGIGVKIFEVATAIGEVMAAAEGVVPAVIAASAAFLGLDVAMGPVGLVILAVGALAAGAFLVVANWDKVKTWFAHFLDFMTTSPFVPEGIRQLMGAAAYLVTHWSEVAKTFEGVGNAIKSMYDKIPTALKVAWFHDYGDLMPKGSHVDVDEKDLPPALQAVFRASAYKSVMGAMAPARAGPWDGALGVASAPKARVDIVLGLDGKMQVKSVQSDSNWWDVNAYNGPQGAH